MKKLLTAIGAALGFATMLNAAEINLREWLTGKGLTAADIAACVSGAGDAKEAGEGDYGVAKLFDGNGTGKSRNGRFPCVQQSQYSLRQGHRKSHIQPLGRVAAEGWLCAAGDGRIWGRKNGICPGQYDSPQSAR